MRIGIEYCTEERRNSSKRHRKQRPVLLSYTGVRDLLSTGRVLRGKMLDPSNVACIQDSFIVVSKACLRCDEDPRHRNTLEF